MEFKFFKPTQGKDGNYYLRVITSEEDALGILRDKTGFLKFRDESKAEAVFNGLEGGDLEITAMLPIANSSLYEVNVAKVGEMVHA
jgi:hypothetical protein